MISNTTKINQNQRKSKKMPESQTRYDRKVFQRDSETRFELRREDHEAEHRWDDSHLLSFGFSLTISAKVSERR